MVSSEPCLTSIRCYNSSQEKKISTFRLCSAAVHKLTLHFCCLLTILYVQSTAGVQLNLRKPVVTNKTNALNFKNEELVKVTIKVVEKNGRSLTYQMNTEQDVELVRGILNKITGKVEITVVRQSGSDLHLDIKRSSMIIPKNFVKRYFTSTGKPVVKKLNPRQSFCYFTGKLANFNSSIVSLNLCNGVEGNIEVQQNTLTLKSYLEKSKIWHKLTRQRVERHRTSMCGTKGSNQTFHHSDIRNKRQVRAPAGIKSTTKFLEIYIVMDHQLYRRTGGTVDASVQRAIDIINFASVIYQKLDIFLALVGVEVWNDRNKISYPVYASDPREISAAGLTTEFSKYRFNEINKHTANDNAQLLADVDLETSIIGYAWLNTICSRTHSSGVIDDTEHSTLTYTAIILTHELGHNLGFYHTDGQDIKAKCNCPPEEGRDKPTCVMHSVLGIFYE